MNDMELHKVEIMKDGNWEEVHFQQLNVGDSFRMTDLDGNLFVDTYGEILSAVSKPFYDEELGTWLVHIK